MAQDEAVVWKPDPDDRSLVHTVVKVQGFGTIVTHCGTVLEVDTMKNEPPAKWQKPCVKCRDARRG